MDTTVPSVRVAPLTASYTYQSAIPDQCVGGTGARRVPCVLGVDEAGRGPVLGPLVYGIAYCPEDQQEMLRDVGFAGWAVRVMSPQDISAGMLKRRAHNLNAQSSDATVLLIQGILDSGVDITKIFVDTVGDPNAYKRLLQSHFPRHTHIEWTVTRKADAIYPIVGAASIAAKVTRDRCLEHWMYAERNLVLPSSLESAAGQKRKHEDDEQAEEEEASAYVTGSGYPGDPRTVRYLQETLDPVFGWAGIVRFSWATAKTMLEEARPTRGSRRGQETGADDVAYSPFGTRLPSATRGYTVRWIDEPATLTDFFSRAAPRKIGAPRGMSTKAKAPAAAAAPAPALPVPQRLQQADQEAQRKHRSALWRDLSLSHAGAADLFG
ncbi:hypothetical protein CBS9595_002111 [Malassezia furfur]|nr:hypothetical protein CBS9595_002111 [Malassezia furfur]